ncbi:MAG: DUF1697 domain-containing protein [Ignavibacteria bacterium]|nr:DUF1697 domain-containing protein [Ignavibacteria bacterium]
MTYYAFLKGINLGKRTIRMTVLKDEFEKLGFGNIRTFIASGNVVFESSLKADSIKVKIEKALKYKFSFDVIVFIRNQREMEKIISGYPFSNIKGDKDYKISVGFLSEKPGKAAIKELESFSTESEIMKVKGDTFYHLTKGKFSDSMVFKKNLPEKILKVVCTIRNLNTVNKILTI